MKIGVEVDGNKVVSEVTLELSNGDRFIISEHKIFGGLSIDTDVNRNQMINVVPCYINGVILRSEGM